MAEIFSSCRKIARAFIILLQSRINKSLFLFLSYWTLFALYHSITDAMHPSLACAWPLRQRMLCRCRVSSFWNHGRPQDSSGKLLKSTNRNRRNEASVINLHERGRGYDGRRPEAEQNSLAPQAVLLRFTLSDLTQKQKPCHVKTYKSWSQVFRLAKKLYLVLVRHVAFIMFM